MNKKIVVIFSVILACVFLGLLARNLQSNYTKKLSNTTVPSEHQTSEVSTKAEEGSIHENNAQPITNISETKENKSEPKDSSPSKEITAPTTPSKQPKPNFIVIDTTSNKTLFSTFIDYKGDTLENITKRIIGSNCVVRGGYFKEMYGLKERAAGPSSGWCFYINNAKSSIGAGSYVPQKDDIIIWKYLKDGLSN